MGQKLLTALLLCLGLVGPVQAQGPIVYLPIILSSGTVNGQLWDIGTNLPNNQVRSIVEATNGDIYAGSGVGGQIIRSQDNGVTWQAVTPPGLKHNHFPNDLLALSNGDILAGFWMWQAAPVVMRYNGATWTDVTSPEMSVIWSLLQTPSGAVIAAGEETGFGGAIWRSTDNGATWTHTYYHQGTEDFISLSLTSTGAILAGNQRGLLIRSTDDGQTWTTVKQFEDSNIVFIRKLNNGWLYLSQLTYPGYQGKLYRSTDNGLTWTNSLTSPNNTFNNMTERNGVTFMRVSASGPPFTNNTGSLYRSTDSGVTWTYDSELRSFGWAGRAGLLITSQNLLLTDNVNNPLSQGEILGKYLP